MKEAMTKVFNMLTLDDFHVTFQKVLERYNKFITARGDYFDVDYSFMFVLSIKVPIRKKKSGNLVNDPRSFAKLKKVIWTHCKVNRWKTTDVNDSLLHN